MEEFRLDELCMIKSFDPNRFWRERDTDIYSYDTKKQTCFFSNPVVLVGMLKPLDFVYVEKDYKPQKRMFCLCNKTPNAVLTKYLYYYMRANKDVLDNFCIGTTIANLRLDDLKKMRIQIPPIVEQMQMVKLQELIQFIGNKNARCLELLDEILLSYYNMTYQYSATSWKQKRMSSLFEENDKRTIPNGTFDVIPKDNGVVFTSKKMCFWKVDMKKCNPYFLACALKRLFESNYSKSPSKCYNQSVNEFLDRSLLIPSLTMQNEYEKLYKRIIPIKENMLSFTDKVDKLFDFLLVLNFHRDKATKDLLTYSSELKKMSHAFVKPTIKEPYSFSTLEGYNEERNNIFKKLSGEVLSQKFDTSTGKIVLL